MGWTPGIVGAKGNDSKPCIWEGEFVPQGEAGENGKAGKLANVL
jgi:hypothetical protein